MTRASTNRSSISEKTGDNQQASTDEKPCMSDKTHGMKNGKSDNGNSDKQEHYKQIAPEASPSRGYQQQSPSKGQKVNL